MFRQNCSTLLHYGSPGLYRKAGQGFNFRILTSHVIHHPQGGAELAGCELHYAIAFALSIGKYKMRVLGESFGYFCVAAGARSDAGATKLNAYTDTAGVCVIGLDVADPIFVNISTQNDWVGNRMPAQRVGQTGAGSSVAIPAIVPKRLTGT